MDAAIEKLRENLKKIGYITNEYWLTLLNKKRINL